MFNFSVIPYLYDDLHKGHLQVHHKSHVEIFFFH